MADSIRERIIQAIMDNVATWTTANGFNLNCGSSSYRARHFWEIAEAPAVSVWPMPETNDPSYAENYNSMPLRLEAVTTYTTAQNPSTIGEQMLADMKELMGQKRSDTVDELADSVRYSGGGVDEYPDSSQTVVGCYAEFNIAYWEKRNDPYNQ